MADAFKLLHFHIGSQVPDILIIKRAVREAARYYAKLRKMGHPIEYLDVGGGLAIDYDGSRSTFHSSMNYSVEEYARDVVYNITDVCDEEKVPHPNIVSESGRAIVAHHSVLVVEAFGAIEKTPTSPARARAARSTSSSSELDVHRGAPLRAQPHRVAGTTSSRSRRRRRRCSSSASSTLDVKAHVETLFWQIAERMQKIADDARSDRGPRRHRAISQASSPTSTSATSRSSSRCSTTGRSARSSRSCRSTASTSGPQLAEHAGRHHLRLRRQGQQVHRPQRRARHAAAPRASSERAVLPRHLPDRRLPGHHGRHPQPLRPRERGPRLPR